jgi:hypothetical protein
VADAVVTIGARTEAFDRSVSQALGRFGKQSTQAASRARVFTTALSALTDQGGQTARVMGAVLGGFAAGGVIGLAIGGVSLLTTHLREAKEAQTRLDTESKNVAKALADAVARGRELAAALQFGDAGGKIVAHTNRVIALTAELADLEAKRAKAHAEWMSANAGISSEKALQRLAIVDQEIKAKKQEIKNLDTSRRIEIQGEEAKGAAETARLADKKAAEDKRRADEKKREADRDWNEWHAMLTRQYAEEERLAEEFAEKQKKLAEWHSAQKARLEDMDFELAIRRAEELAAAYERALQPVGAALSNLMADVVLDGRNAAEAAMAAIKSLAAQALSTIVQMGVKSVAAKLAAKAADRPVHAAQVTSAAGVAGAEGAAAVAGIPIVGPALALETLATLPAAIMSSMLPLASARGGWEVPSFGSQFPAVLHPNEMVIPAWGKQALKNMAAMDSGGGGVTVNIATPDARGVDRLFQRSDSAVSRALRKAQRQRRGA